MAISWFFLKLYSLIDDLSTEHHHHQKISKQKVTKDSTKERKWKKITENEGKKGKKKGKKGEKRGKKGKKRKFLRSSVKGAHPCATECNFSLW